MNNKPRHVFLCGIGGSGMSPLALVLLSQGCKVTGSDRAHDQGETPDKFAQLAKIGIILKPQDGSGVDADIDAVIISSAVEKVIPDVEKAKKLGIEVFKRADILAQNFNSRDGIAIGGTSGKSSVTAMLGHILKKTGGDPTVVNGAPMVNAIEDGVEGLGSALIGKSDTFVIEADESDGTIALYDPKISVLTNVTLDHRPVSETLPLFKAFLERAEKGAVVNLDNEASASLADAHPHTLTFSLNDKNADIYGSDLKMTAEGATFTIEEKGGDKASATLLVPGKHNIENALAAIAAARLTGVSLEDATMALSDFKGVKRRLEFLGREDGITLIDDFGHNPDKIAASMAALRQVEGRLLVVFQPHGFSPMRLMGKDMAASFYNAMRDDDILLLPDILYKGGDVTRDVSSADTVQLVNDNGKKALHIPERDAIMEFLLKEAKSGDRIVIMGARDDSLTEFGLSLLKKIKGRGKTPSPKGPEL